MAGTGLPGYRASVTDAPSRPMVLGTKRSSDSLFPLKTVEGTGHVIWRIDWRDVLAGNRLELAVQYQQRGDSLTFNEVQAVGDLSCPPVPANDNFRAAPRT